MIWPSKLSRWRYPGAILFKLITRISIRNVSGEIQSQAVRQLTQMENRQPYKTCVNAASISAARGKCRRFRWKTLNGIQNSGTGGRNPGIISEVAGSGRYELSTANASPLAGRHDCGAAHLAFGAGTIVSDAANHCRSAVSGWRSDRHSWTRARRPNEELPWSSRHH